MLFEELGFQYLGLVDGHNIEKLEGEISAKHSELMGMAEKISLERKNYAQVLSAMIVEKLEKLELPKVRFEIGFEPCDLGINGIDKVEFLISTNKNIFNNKFKNAN